MQYCLSASVVNIVKHALLPNYDEEDEFTDMSMWVLIEVTHDDVTDRRGH